VLKSSWNFSRFGLLSNPAFAPKEYRVYFLFAGIVLLGMKYMEFGPVANWSWLAVLSPFALAAAWWAWADATGYTKKKAMQKMDKRKQDRLDKQREALGLNGKSRRK